MKKKNDQWGGILDISVKSVFADKIFCKNYPEARQGNYFLVTISDNGVGMDEKEIKNIFTPFYTTKEKEAGTGLGLSMVLNIVQLHKGFVSVYSKPGIGTTFNIFFPEIKDKDKTENKKTAIKKDFHFDGLILAIDDEQVIHTILKDMLEEFGMTVLCANNGIEGIKLFKEKNHDINLVILDMAMPGKSGLEVYKQLKEIDPEVKVLLTSGHMQDKRVSEALKLGINGFVKKPFTLENLIEPIAKIIS